MLITPLQASNRRIQPPSVVNLNTGHPIGSRLVAGWVWNTLYARELITGFPSIFNNAGFLPGILQSRSGPGVTSAGQTGWNLYTNATDPGRSRLDNLTNNFTVVSFCEYPADGDDWLIYSDTGGFACGTDIAGGGLQFFVNGVAAYEYAAGLTAGMFYMLGWVIHDGNVNFYVDGRLVNTQAIGTISPASAIWQMGDRAGFAQNWNGRIDCVYMFDAPFPGEVMALLAEDPYCFLRQQPTGFAYAINSIFTRDQEGYRFRADDGSETTATWLASQDANVSRAKLTNTRLRLLTNAVGDAPSEGLKLQYRKVGDDGWRDL